MITGPTQFVELVENTLGWIPAEPRWRSLMREAGKVNRKIAEDPTLYSWDNLELTVELLRRERRPVRTPTGVFHHVGRAVAAAHSEVTSDLAGHIHAAIVEAFTAGEPEWVERLSRASGDARADVLAEWRAVHG